MKLTEDKYEKVIIALDSIRCDNRENKTIEGLRQIDDVIMEYIERKGYCKYILGERNVFIRTLTDKGYEVLGCGSYKKYLKQKRNEKIRLKTPIFISAFALVMSISSFLFGVFQYRNTSRTTQEHNKLSVRPILNIERNISDSYTKVGLTLKNKGIGPALIVSQELYYDGKQINNWSDLTPLLEREGLVFWQNFTPQWFNVDFFTLSANEELDLYNIDIKNLKDLSKAISAFDKISILYTYTDMYKDTFNFDFQKELISNIPK
ncbi:MAG: hypothetical protein JST86_11500 [Bacteroidetes bacterium]|nr:hypothetical protein [Bacteroidota bacterium]